jgi:molecular chaperone DnaK
MAIYGIDLGTTYSSMGYVDEFGRPAVIRNSEGMDTTPSVVFFEGENNVVVGSVAKNTAMLYPDNVVSFIKRDMGRADAARTFFDKSYTPEEISSLILKKLVADAQRELGDGKAIREVVITCPAYFGIGERTATQMAGKLAGLEVREILNEPTAAAIYYGSLNRDAAQSVLVYDLGGGTFDVTVIQIGSGIEVKYTGGDHQLGGKDWDQRIIEHMAGEIRSALPDAGAPDHNADTMQGLYNQAEQVKKSLSTLNSSMVVASHEGRPVSIKMTRAQLEEMTRDLLDQTIRFTKTAIEEAKAKGIPRIDKILLVGGSSRMPQVEERLKQEFGIPTQMFEPDLAVVKGAAIRAHQLRGDVGGLPPARPPIDVVSHGLGIQVQADDSGRKEVVHLIHAQQPVPVEHTRRDFSTIQNSQTSIHIQVMEQTTEQESAAVEDNKLIADGFISNIPPGLPKGSPITVTFRIEEQGLLEVRAFEPSSGREVKIEIKIHGVSDVSSVQLQKMQGVAVAV